MAAKNLKAFDGITILTSELDEIEVGHLLKAKESLSLVCQECGGSRFEAEGIIRADLEVISSKHIAVTRLDYSDILVNRVTKCAHCHSTDFVRINNPTEEDYGQKQSSVG